MTFEREKVTLTFTNEEKDKIQDIINIFKEISFQMYDHSEETLTGVNRPHICITDEDIDNTISILQDLLAPDEGFIVE